MVDTSPEWVARATRRILTPEQIRCIEVLCTIARPYNLQLIGDRWSGAVDYSIDNQSDEEDPVELPAIEFAPTWMIARLHHQSMSTYDGDELTRLVLAAHQKSVRVDIRAQRYLQVDPEGEYPSAPAACLYIQLNARVEPAPGDSQWERHPTIDNLIARASIVIQR